MEKFDILLVDDDINNLELLVDILEDPSRNLITAISGYDALKVVKENNVGLIISDLKMPEMNGIELLQNLKSTKIDYFIPVIIITGNSHNDSIRSLIVSFREFDIPRNIHSNLGFRFARSF